MASVNGLSRASSRTASVSSSDGADTWKYVDKQHWQPDRVPDSDASMLNYKKQQRAKDPRTALREQLEHQKMVKKMIQELIRKPFIARGGVPKMDEVEGAAAADVTENLITEKVAAKKKYVLAHFSHSYKVKEFHFPSEFAFVEFSVYNGLGKGIQGFVDTGDILEGFRFEVIEQCRYLSNPMPPFDPDFNADRDALQLIRDFLAQHFEENETAIIFALKEYIPVVTDGLNWLKDAASCVTDNDSDGTAASRIRTLRFEVLPLSSLIVELMNESQTPEYRGDIADSDKFHVDHECLIEDEMRQTKFSYYSDLACEYHMKIDNIGGVPRCCETLVKSYVFNAFNLIKPFFKIDEKPNMHYPDLKLTARKTVNKRIRESSVVAGPNVQGFFARFVSSERITDFITNFSGSEISASTTTLERQSSSGSQTSLEESQKSWSASASDVVGSTTTTRRPPGRQFTLRTKPVQKDKFKVDPEVRYAYNLEDYQNRTAKKGEVDMRPSYEEVVVNKAKEGGYGYLLGPSKGPPHPHSQPSRIYRPTTTAPGPVRENYQQKRPQGQGRGYRTQQPTIVANDNVLKYLGDINEPAFEDLPPAVKQEDIHETTDDDTVVDARSHVSLSTNSTITGVGQQAKFFRSFAQGEPDDTDDSDEYPDSASIVNLKNLKM